MPIKHPSAHTIDNTLTVSEYEDDHTITTSLDLFNKPIVNVGNLTPYDADGRDLGSTSKEWRNVFVGNTIFFGTNQDTNLYRGGANALKTDDEFYAVSRIRTDSYLWGDGGLILGPSYAPIQGHGATQSVLFNMTGASDIFVWIYHSSLATGEVFSIQGTDGYGRRFSVYGNKNVKIYGTLDMDSHKIVSVTDPTNAQDVATKNYVDGLVTGSVPTREFFSPSISGDSLASWYYNHPGHEILQSADDVYAGFYVPWDYSAITDSKVVLVSKSAGTFRFNLYINYGATGENANQYSGEVLDTEVTVSTNRELAEIDISSALGALASGDYVGIRVTGDPVNTPNVLIKGIRFKYT